MKRALAIAVFALAAASPAVGRAQGTPGEGAPAPPTEVAPTESPAPRPAPALEAGGGPVPAADTHGSALPAEAKKPRSRPFAGSALYNQNSVTTGTIFRGQQLDYNPTVESLLYLLPRYALSDAWQIRARAILSYEYTNSDSSNYRNEPLLSDTTLQLFYRKIPKVLGFQPAVAANLALPTSKLSRGRTLLFSPGATLQISQAWEHVLGGELAILASTAYSHPVYRSRNPEVVDRRPPAFSCFGGNNCQDLISGTMNPSDILSYSAIVEMEWGKWAPAIMYLGASQWTYTPKEVSNPVDGTPVQSAPGFEPTAVRQTHYVSAWLDYNFNSWFTGEVGFWNSASAIDNRGQRSAVLFDRYQDTRVYFGASIQLDNLVRTLQGDDDGEAGVVRAKSDKQPMFTF